VHAIQANSGDNLVGEAFRGRVDHADPALSHQIAPDGMHQVSLTHPGSSVDEQGVIGAGRVGRNGPGGSVSELVGSSNHESLKCKLGIEVGFSFEIEGCRRPAVHHLFKHG